MTKLETINAEDLQNRTYEPTPFLVDELIPEGLHILAGAPKIGKSWLALWLCLCVSQGQPLWNFATTQSEALYLSLEDSFQRIQTRLFDLTEDAPPTLHFAIMADTLKHGLEQQIEQFLTEHPDTKLVVIDTLQRVRSTGNDSNLYANDYQDIGLLKRLADRRHIAILLIHHLRKLHDDDPMNMISGSTGLSGAADSTFVLQKNSRLANIASLHCTGRDIPDRTLKLEFGEEDHIWKLLEDSKTCSTTSKISMLQIEILLSELLQKESEISAPAKALLEKIDPAGSEAWTPNSFSHQIRKSVDTLRQNGILVSFRKSNGERLICLKRVDGADLPTVEKIAPIAHAFRSLLLELHLRMAVGALQERRIAMTSEVCDRVFVHALMQKLFGTTGIAGGFLYTISPDKPSDDGLPGLRVSADYDFVSSCSCSFFSSADCFARMALT
ncbi:MAG: helicase RepA family protein, partial [Clostridiales bacterium]|nr:helicase RepA family protein [Clostridiales bacterium]